ncbi:XRE family transcriptional regulator [Campylobacter suis]|uniref:HTH-type transcriptional regulator n=1 Tax=Campylobacter suis TaxID=2790657 RepID=A0ABN7K6X0_9BACT|nr:S24 family peptidase [Campylobacter suis]CAD7288253.1 putative HTH-type transcriptional regulator [Campylobacter suis]
MKTFATKLKELIDAKEGLDTVKLANILGVSQSAVSQWQLGQKGVSKTNIAKVANFFNVPIEYLINDNIMELKNLTNKQELKNNDNTIYVPFFKNGLVSAGFGNENDDMGDYDLLPFKPEDLRLMFNVSPRAKIGIIPCLGNSMEPTIHESDLIVFCNDGEQIVEGAVYICRYDGELFVKRLKKRPFLALISDNKDYEPIPIAEDLDVQIIGRVVGSYSINSKRL